MTTAKEMSVIFLTGDRLNFFNFVNSLVYQLVLTPTAIKNQEIISIEELDKQINAFVQQNGFTPSELIILLSDEILYYKNYPESEEVEVDKQITAFFNNVPFEYVSKMVIRAKNYILAYATNELFLRAIKSSFEKLGFNVVYIVPAFSIANQVQALDPAFCAQVINRIESIKEYSFLLESDSLIQKQDEKPIFPKQEKNINYKLIIFAAILIILILVLVYMVITQTQPNG